MSIVPVEPAESAADLLEMYIELEDEAVHNYILRHNKFLRNIEYYDNLMDNGAILGQAELSRIEYWYAKARFYAYSIAGYYRSRQKLYEGRAEQEQANFYEEVRLGDYNKKMTTATDAQYLSRRAKGRELMEGARHHGNYDRWMGIALSHESAINSLKDTIKQLLSEQGAGKYT